MSPAPDADSPAADHDALLTVGDISARLGVAPETVRSWGKRYGMEASARSAGGHRRFSSADLDRFVRMQLLVAEGIAPAAAAKEATDVGTGEPLVPVRRRAPGGRTLSIPNGSPRARGLARAASRLDAETATALIGDWLIADGVHQTWERVLRPVLMAAGLRWMRTGEGVEVEHVLSEAAIDALRSYLAFLPKAVPGRPVLLAGAPDDMHTLPLHVLAAALGEVRVPTLMLGARVPLSALATAAQRTGASGVFVWQQLADDTAPALAAAGLRSSVLIVLGGPGWPAAARGGVSASGTPRHASTLADAVSLLRETPR